MFASTQVKRLLRRQKNVREIRYGIGPRKRQKHEELQDWKTRHARILFWATAADGVDNVSIKKHEHSLA